MRNISGDDLIDGALKAEEAVVKYMVRVSHICLYLRRGVISYFQSGFDFSFFCVSLLCSQVVGVQQILVLKSGDLLPWHF